MPYSGRKNICSGQSLGGESVAEPPLVDGPVIASESTPSNASSGGTTSLAVVSCRGSHGSSETSAHQRDLTRTRPSSAPLMDATLTKPSSVASSDDRAGLFQHLPVEGRPPVLVPIGPAGGKLPGNTRPRHQDDVPFGGEADARGAVRLAGRSGKLRRMPGRGPVLAAAVAEPELLSLARHVIRARHLRHDPVEALRSDSLILATSAGGISR